MKTGVKILIAAAVGYLGFKAYQFYTAIKQLTFYPTGIRFKIDAKRGSIGGIVYVDINNPTTGNIRANGFNGKVALEEGTIIGTYQSGGLLLKPGINKIVISWSARSSLSLVSVVINLTKRIFPKLVFTTVFNIKGIPIPTSFKMNTADYIPTFI